MVPDNARRTALSAVGFGLLAFSGVSSNSILSRSSSTHSESLDPDTDFDWPMARYDPAGTGYNPNASGPKEGVRVKWRRNPDGFSGGTASPILLGDTLYAVGQSLVALDSNTSSTKFSYEGSYQSSPARVEATAYRTDTLAVSAPTGVYGLNAGGGISLLGYELGVERWHGASEEPDFTFFGPPTVAPPVAAGDTVYASVPRSDEPDTAYIVALDANSGDERWRRSSGDELRRFAIRDGTLFAVNWPNHVAAYHADSGNRLWQRDVKEQMVLAPTATKRSVLVPDRTSVTALDSRDGSVRWRFRHDGNATEGAAAVAEGRVFVLSDAIEGSLYALDAETGTERWSVPLSGEGTPVVADGVVYVSNLSSTEIVAVDAKTGTVRWRFDTRYPVSPPVAGDGVVYAVADSTILALEEKR